MQAGDADPQAAHRGVPIVFAALVSLCLAVSAAPASGAAVDRDPAVVAEEARSAERLSVGLGYGGSTYSPGSYGESGPAALVQMPLFMGSRRKVVQWDFGFSLLAGYGTTSHDVHFALAVHPGVRLHLGSVYAMELRMGPAALAQLGGHRVLGAAPFFFAMQHAFRFWQDDRKRLVISLAAYQGFMFARDRGNDCAFCAMGAVVTAGYEAPF